jgi:hypothetical protein
LQHEPIKEEIELEDEDKYDSEFKDIVNNLRRSLSEALGTLKKSKVEGAEQKRPKAKRDHYKDNTVTQEVDTSELLRRLTTDDGGTGGQLLGVGSGAAISRNIESKAYLQSYQQDSSRKLIKA